MINFEVLKNKVIHELSLPSVTDEINQLVNECIRHCLENYNYIEDIKKVNINVLKKYLPDTDNVWKALNGAEAVYVGLLSLGQKSQIYLEQVRDKSCFESYLIDVIYNLILDQCFSRVWCNLQEELQDHEGLMSIVAPGERDFSLELQKTIFEFFSSPEIELDQETLFMSPMKSITFLIGVAKNIPSYNLEHRCRDCNNSKCHQRFVDITINNVRYQVPYQERLYDVLVDKKIFFDGYCAGNHQCGKCKVLVKKNNKGETKLACDTYCSSGLEVTTMTDFDKIQVQDTYQGIRHTGTSVRSDDSYGIVFDVGTTTIVGGIYHLGSKKEMQVIAMHNEQYLYGLDVISRIGYTLNNKSGLQQLNQSIINQLNTIITTLSKGQLHFVSKIVIVGNPTMISILNNINLSSLASYPYESHVNCNIVVDTKAIGLVGNAEVTFLGGVSSFIGSDILSGLVASKFYEADDYQLIVDLGTNGEIALGNKYEIYTCSTAAGPAFEGAKISCGVPSVPGAICSFGMVNGKYRYETIHNEPPIGFCGSGILDMIATLLHHQVVDSSGLFRDMEHFSINLEPNTFTLTQQDIREFQLAKSAIRTGIEILLSKAKICITQLKSIFISGGLGSNIDVGRAVEVGLLPNTTENKVHLIGNSAYYGASLYLLYDEYQEVFSKTKAIMSSIDLNDEEGFIDLFVKYLSLD